jgi:hypothetical protein
MGRSRVAQGDGSSSCCCSANGHDVENGAGASGFQRFLRSCGGTSRRGLASGTNAAHSFFASDHAKAVTGQYLLVNSGEMFR